MGENGKGLDVKEDKQEIGIFLRFWGAISKLGLDFLGIILICLFLVSVLGFLPIEQGLFVEKWTNILEHLVGWGKYYAIVLFLLLGILCFQRHIKGHKGLSFSRILSAELLVFTIPMLLDLITEHDLETANQGGNGGVIGWGLVEIFQPKVNFLAWVLAIILTICLLLHASGLLKKITDQIEKWLDLEKVEDLDPDQVVINESSPLIDNPDYEAIDLTYDNRARDERLPPLNILSNDTYQPLDEDTIRTTARKIESTLLEFAIPAKVVGYRTGPTVTQYAVEPGFTEKEQADGDIQKLKVRVSRIASLEKDITLALSADKVRIEAPVPGRSYIGIEIPNPNNSLVRLRSLLETDSFQKLSSPLAIAIGKDVSGQPVTADLSRMPHLLIAGATGTGKSVCLTTMTTCLVMNNAPADLRLVMIDPKMVELVRFTGLPHLLGGVETDQGRIQAALQWAVMEMDNRYRIMEAAHSRDVDTFNRRMQRKNQPTLCRIVIIIDELADLMMVQPEHTEFALVRLAQMARATGMHLVVATQRPSTNVITGVIKANFPARLAFSVASSVDSRVILDANGAESLLGKGDCLFFNPEVGALVRAQGIFVTDREVNKVISFWNKMLPLQEKPSAPWESLVEKPSTADSDGLLEKAIDAVKKAGHASASLLQRRLRIGYPRAAHLIDELEEMGVVGPAQVGGKERDLLPSDDNKISETNEEDLPLDESA